MSTHFSPFLHWLPVEVRLPIYRYVLPYSTYQEDREESDCPVVWFPGKCPGILFVNKQINREATEILYRENIFALYVRHPQAARLPMNESRPDSDSFVLISWSQSTWAHPRNPRIPFSVLRSHTNLENVRRLHISLPPFDDLIGVDVFMRKSSYAGFHGISAWLRKCATRDNQLDEQEKERLGYIQKYKIFLDEVGRMLQTLPRLDQLYLSFQTGKFDVYCREYLLSEILLRRNVRLAKCFYAGSHLRGRSSRGDPNDLLLRTFEQILQSRSGEFAKAEQYLCKEMEAMYWLLQAIREKQLLDDTAARNERQRVGEPDPIINPIDIVPE